MSEKSKKTKKRLVTDFFGEGSSKNKKSKSDGPTTSANRRHKPVFLVCPGAGGLLPKDGTLEAQLGRLGRVAVIPKSTGYNGMKGCVAKGTAGSLNENLKIVNNFIAQEGAASSSSSSSESLVLVGQSFGCRAIVHWLCGNHEVRKHPSIPVPWSDEAMPDNYQELRSKISKVIFFGYPLAHATQDRSAALKQLPETIRAYFVIGTNDKMALGDKLSKKTLKETLKEVPAATELIWVDKGGHSPPNEKKWTGMDLNGSINAFLNEDTDTG